MSGAPQFEPKEDAKHFFTNKLAENQLPSLLLKCSFKRFCHIIPYGDYFVVT